MHSGGSSSTPQGPLKSQAVALIVGQAGCSCPQVTQYQRRIRPKPLLPASLCLKISCLQGQSGQQDAGARHSAHTLQTSTGQGILSPPE